jgi:serine/threonine protein kinase
MRASKGANDATPSEDASGRLVAGRYRITELIGRGGMAAVHRAWDTQLGRDVALKIFRSELASAEDLRRQQDEVRVLARLTHPSLVTLYDAVSDEDGRAVLVLEYVPGTDARKRLVRGPIPEHTVAAIGRDIAHALAHLHSRGIVHRDVSPANVLLPTRKPDDHNVDAKLTDLGIARLLDESRITATGSIIGTAEYLSPEQAQGLPLSPASDIYSLGLVLLECLTGQRPFPGSAMESAVARVTRDPAVPAHLDARWRDLLLSMTRREPAERPAATAVAEALRPLAAPRIGAELEPDAQPRTVPLPSSVSGQRTKVLPAPPRRDATGATAVITKARTTGSDVQRPPRRLRLRALALTLGVLAAVVLVGVLVPVLTARQQSSRPEPTYPAISGQLGDHLKQLERDVSSRHVP